MRTKLRIGIKLWRIGTLEKKWIGNVNGDEQVARYWRKYLLRSNEVDYVFLYGPADQPHDSLHVIIHFNPFLEPQPGVRNVLYLQNAFPRENFPGGTIGVFEAVQSRFEGYIFTSQALMAACRPGAVIPFATDPEVFFPQKSELYSHPVCFVGNDIRGPAVNHRYLIPALPFGLVIYGNTWAPPLSTAVRGKLPDLDLPKVYTSAAINLNAHIAEHVEWDTINLRVYDALACGGFVLSDYVPSLAGAFGEAVVATKGDEDLWAKLIRYSIDQVGRQKRVEIGRKIVLNDHTYQKRMHTLISYLRALL